MSLILPDLSLAILPQNPVPYIPEHKKAGKINGTDSWFCVMIDFISQIRFSFNPLWTNLYWILLRH